MRRSTLYLAAVALAVAAFLISPFGREILAGRDTATEMTEGAVQTEPASPVGLGSLASSYTLAFQSIPVQNDAGNGGAIAAAGSDVYLLTRLGRFSVMEEGAPAFRPIEIAPPVDAARLAGMFERQVQIDSIGYRDLLIRRRGGGLEFTVSYLDADAEVENCISLAISRMVQSPEGPAGDWEELYRSAPCIPADQGFFLQAGGAMAVGPDETLYVFVGDFGLDNFNRSWNGVGPQNPDTEVGKVMAISPEGQVEVISQGHRNPGGLVFSAENGLILSEHGPRGGDELNAVRQGRDYGWPSETLGTQYGELAWPPDDTEGQHDRFALPQFAWVPSIAVSALAEIGGAEFPKWEGDLVMATLRDKSLRRIRMERGRVVIDERIPVGARIRDLTVAESGKIYLKLDKIPDVVAVTNANAGLSLIPEGLAYCVGCHQVNERDTAEYVGPTLVGLIGREIASVSDFRYSPALAGMDGTWNAGNLQEFLMNTQSFAPGSSMPELDIGSLEVRAAVRSLTEMAARE